MLNKYIKKYDSRLAEELRKESAGAMSLNWEDSYKDTKYSIERIEHLEEYEDDKNMPSGIGWFVFLIVVMSVFYIAFIGSFHFPARKMVIYAIIGISVVVGLCFLGRFLFYHAIERRLIFAENRRLTHENRYPGISNLVLDYLEKGSDEIPPRIEPAVPMAFETNPIDEDFEVEFDKEKISREIEESLNQEEVDGATEVDEADEATKADGTDEVDEADEPEEATEDNEATSRDLFTGKKTIIVVYPKNLRDAIDESIKILSK